MNPLPPPGPAAAHPWRPWVIANAAMSADGKIAPVEGTLVPFGSDQDRAQMEELRTRADAVLIGGGTLRTEDPPLLILDPALRARRQAAKGSPHPLNVTVCNHLPKNLETLRFFNHPETTRLVFTSLQTPPDLLALANQHATVEVVPLDETSKINLRSVMEILYKRGVRLLLLEGGGELNFSMLAAGLVDELYLTVCPFLFGGRSAPTPFDGSGFPGARVQQLELCSSRANPRGELFLHYRLLQGPDQELHI